MFLSVFDLYKIGIGPSSSHTMGPMTAAARFLAEIRDGDWPRPRGAVVDALRVTLHGSLAFTGVGHASDRAVILGLSGFTPDEVDPDRVDELVAGVEACGEVRPASHPAYRFRPDRDLVLDRGRPLPGHSNGLTFEALDREGAMLLRRVYYSIGGGFVVSEEELQRGNNGPAASGPAEAVVPHPFRTAAEALAMARATGLSIAGLQRENELARLPARELDRRLDAITEAMEACVGRGIRQEGMLPGGLGVRRRAKSIHDRLQADAARNVFQPLLANDWLSVFAMAVNEENACGGRVVTAPTNGAAGVVPAVLAYLRRFHPEAGRPETRLFLLTSAAIGGIIKRNASISGAEVGCQGKVGSASAMAAAGLAAVMGGTPEQVENAAEIALEHHLGMTCDPVGGLVQIPCIERNAFGAVKAVTAASLAMKGEGLHVVPLDACIETMRQTGRDMDHRYKETSLGGLAVNLPEC
ncbi:L-serine ammonia-lyase [Aureimonas sp. AU4]|uniref:L-serine ammonia-lyase n=1 Tax=Aureimonas sp. AU4 TaxID=1638163 RepID=UPI000784AB0F|nr:L-serine ammonia-lyase [Aureimonas sp. AU4]